MFRRLGPKKPRKNRRDCNGEQESNEGDDADLVNGDGDGDGDDVDDDDEEDEVETDDILDDGLFEIPAHYVEDPSRFVASSLYVLKTYHDMLGSND